MWCWVASAGLSCLGGLDVVAEVGLASFGLFGFAWVLERGGEGKGKYCTTHTLERRARPFV